MKFTPVTDPLPGERVVAVEPPPSPFVDAPWSRQRFVTGRSVSATALTAEQDHRAAQVARLGRTHRAGVIQGLDVRVDAGASPLRLELLPGQGLCESGEDVIVPSRTPFDPWALPARVPASLRTEALGDEPEVRLDALFAARGVSAWPLTCILVAEPVVVEELASAGDPTDPCERDPDAEAFEDWRWVDGVRLLWVPLEALADEGDPAWPRAGFLDRVDLARWRNQLAWDLARVESALRPGEVLPWARDGLPLVAACFDHAGALLFLDRACVARRGGHQGWADEAVVAGGAPEVRRALVDQFLEELDEARLPHGASLAWRFRHLPPVGVLPRELFDLGARTSTCFPADWGVSAAPVPLDQLDAALRASSSLEPYDTGAALEQVKVLVPVDPRWFEPDLLRVDSIPLDFSDALEEAADRRDDALRSRAELRAKLRALLAALGGAGSVPRLATEDATDLRAERVVEGTLWRNPQSVAVYDLLGVRGADGTLDLTEDVVYGIALSMLQDAAPASVAAKACLAAGIGEPVVAAGVDAAETTWSAEPGFGVPGTPSHAWMRPDGARIVGGTPNSVRLVATSGTFGVQDLDEWIRLGGGLPLVIVAAGMDDYAREELEWHHRRDPASAPTVVLVRGDEATSVLGDVLTRIRSTPGASGDMVTCTRVVIGERQLVVHLAAPMAESTALQLAASLDEAAAKLAGADREALTRRARLLSGRAAVIAVGGDEEATERVRAVVRCVRALQELHAGADLAELALLAEAGGAREDTYGTVPTPLGLGVGLIEELVDALAAKVTPADGSRVVSQDELTLLAQVGVAGFIQVLEEKVAKANDVIDLGYLQVQSAVYRIREQVLGRDAAQKMASSPVLGDLAEILDGDTSPDQVAKFFDALREAATTPPVEPGATPPATPPSWLEGALNVSVTKAVLDSSGFRFKLTEPLAEMAKVTVATAALLPPPPVAPTEVKLLDGAALPEGSMSLFFKEATTRSADTSSLFVRNALAGATWGF